MKREDLIAVRDVIDRYKDDPVVTTAWARKVAELPAEHNLTLHQVQSLLEEAVRETYPEEFEPTE